MNHMTPSATTDAVLPPGGLRYQLYLCSKHSMLREHWIGICGTTRRCFDMACNFRHYLDRFAGSNPRSL
jgi:hypothetical protein